MSRSLEQTYSVRNGMKCSSNAAGDAVSNAVSNAAAPHSLPHYFLFNDIFCSSDEA